jgi:hypothetical protein
MNQRDRSSLSAAHSINRRHTRRTVLLSLAGAGLAIATIGSRLPAGSAPLRQDDATPSTDAATGTAAQFTSQVFAGEGFVGEARDVPVGEAFVAVVVADAAPGADAREVRALLYGNTQNNIREWFPGAVTGNSLDLASDGGARLRGEFSAEGASGTITMPDGMVFPFNAGPATGVAGLYTVFMYPDGRVEGTSERDVQLVGHLGAKEEGSDLYPITGSLVPPEGDPQAFALNIHISGPLKEELIPSRFVVLEDGRILGGSKNRPGGVNFYSYTGD